MVSEVLEFASGLYFSSLLFIFIPALGFITGAVTGRYTPGVGVALGSLVGLASGILGLALATLVGWLAGGIEDRWRGTLVAFVLPLGGAFAPIAVLQLVRLWRR